MNITIKTISGQEITLTPVPMDLMPSANPKNWNKFQGPHIWGMDLSEAEVVRVQSFMRKANTEALSDGKQNVTIAGSKLATCYPEKFIPTNVFSFRAECMRDVDEFNKQWVKESLAVREINLKITPPLPDVEVEIQSTASFAQLRSCMEEVEDGHVMVETFRACPLIENSLERTCPSSSNPRN